MLRQDEPAMPKGKDAVNLGREGFRQVGESVQLFVDSSALSSWRVVASCLPCQVSFRGFASCFCGFSTAPANYRLDAIEPYSKSPRVALVPTISPHHRRRSFGLASLSGRRHPLKHFGTMNGITCSWRSYYGGP